MATATQKPIVLSYSGMTCLQDCERKFAHRYLLGTGKDQDQETPNYFDFGSCFHKVLELTQHDPRNFPTINFQGIVESYAALDPIADGGRIAALLRNYWVMHAASGLKCCKCELRLDLEKTTAVIDAIMEDALGRWWIVDLKTTGMMDATLPARIARDPQLNHYAACKDAIAMLLDLDPAAFAGVRYREGFKARTEPKAGETFTAYTERVQPSSKVREIIVQRDMLAVADVWEAFAEAWDNADRLRQAVLAGASQGRCNFNACLKWNRPCEFFSQCYGRTFTEAQSSAIVHDGTTLDPRDPALAPVPELDI
jgi:hypothetical protein